jgi:short-subunit dehydrogenase involved in D-alanine esterification of teichoic acids
VPGDVAKLSDLDRLYEIVKVYGPKFDVIFANAGVALQAAFASVEEAPEVRRRNTRVRFVQLLKEPISREVGYGLSLEGSSAADLLK